MAHPLHPGALPAAEAVAAAVAAATSRLEFCYVCNPALRSLLFTIMASTHKLLARIRRGDADANIAFSGMVRLLKRTGISGTH